MYQINVTDIGKELLAKATLKENQINFENFKIMSEKDDISLNSVVFSSLINQVEVDKNELIFTCIVPESASGFWLRSIAILDDQKNIIAFGNIPEIFKSDDQLSPSVSNYTIKLKIENADSIHITFNNQACSSIENYYVLSESLIKLIDQQNKAIYALETYKQSHEEKLNTLFNQLDKRLAVLESWKDFIINPEITKNTQDKETLSQAVIRLANHQNKQFLNESHKEFNHE